MCANLSVDLAANELLREEYPDIADPKEPLGSWVLPEKFEPQLDRKLTAEAYQAMLLATLRKKMKLPPDKLWKLAQKMLCDAKDKLKNAQPPKPGQGQNQEQQGEGQNPGQHPGPSGQQGQTPGQSSGSGQGQSPGSGNPGGSEGGGQGSDGDDVSDIDPNTLDPMDQQILKMLLDAMLKHMAWENAAKEASEADVVNLQQHGKDVVKGVVKNHDKSRGTIPAGIWEQIKRFLDPPVVPWTAFLNAAIQHTKQTKRKRGMARPSKKLLAVKFAATNSEKLKLPAMMRRIAPFPGSKQDKRFTVLYVLDTSGSMSNEDIRKGFSEVQHIQKADPDMKIILINADAEIAKEKVVGPNDEIDFKAYGRGGTDFEPAFLRAKELLSSQDKAPDIMIYCTDGYCPPPQTRLPITTVWLITPNGQPVCRDAGHITIPMQDVILSDD